MKHLKLFEDFKYKDLSSRKRNLYIKELEKMISLKDLYDINVEAWAYVIQDVGTENLDFGIYSEIGMSRREYKSFLEEYRKIAKDNQKLNYLNDFMIGLNGIGADYDYEFLDDQPIEFWIEEFGVTSEVAIMMKSLHDAIEYPSLDPDALAKEILANPGAATEFLKGVSKLDTVRKAIDLLPDSIRAGFKKELGVKSDLKDIGF